MTEPFEDRPELGVPRWRVVTEMLGATLVLATLLLLVGGVLGAMLTSGNLDGTARLELLSRSANPTVGVMILVGVGLVVVPRLALQGPSWSFAGMSATLGALIALVVSLLAVSAMLLDLTTGERTAGLRISLLLFRFGTLVPSVVAVWVGGILASAPPPARATAPGATSRPPEP